MGRRASPSPKNLPGFRGLPLRVFAQEVGEQRCAITRMYVPENCARPRARAHLVMCPWVFAQIPSEHPCANASTHKMRLRDNTGATLSPA